MKIKIKMKIKINKSMISHCSFGVRRYYNEIVSRLNVEVEGCSKIEDLFRGFITRHNKGIVWSPGQGGSVFAYKHIVTCHDVIDFSFYSQSIKNKLKKAIHKYIYMNAIEIIFISNSTKVEFDKIFTDIPAKKTVIKSAVYTDSSFNYNCNILLDNGLEKGKYFILITNRMKHKNNGAFINAIHDVRKKDKRIKGVIVGQLGDGELENVMNDDDGFVNLNYLSNDDLFSLVSDSCSLVSASFIEGHNLTISEAMSLGTNVIASDIPVHREFYNNYCLFFEPSNYFELSEIMIGVIRAKKEFPVFSKNDLRTWDDTASEYDKMFASYSLSPVSD